MTKKQNSIKVLTKTGPPFNEFNLVRACVLPSDYAYYEDRIGMKLTPQDYEALSDDWRKNDIFAVNLPEGISQAIIAKFQQVPGAELSRCWIPGYRLEFFAQGKLRIQAAICWKCDRVAFYDPGKNPVDWPAIGFDGESTEAIELLKLIRNSVSERI
jgi:hypothetical protein